MRLTKKSSYKIYAGLALFLTLACYIHGQSLLYPYMGIEVEHREGVWLITEVERGAGADGLGVKPGDRLTALNGEPVSPEQTGGKSGLSLSRIKTYTFQHEGEELRGVTGPKDWIKQLVAIGTELLLLAMGGYAYFKKPESKLIRKFLVLSSVLALIIMTVNATDILAANLVLVGCSIWISYLMLDFFAELLFTRLHPSSVRIRQVAKALLSLFTLYAWALTSMNVFLGWIREAVLIELIAAIGIMFVLGAVKWRSLDRIRLNYLLVLSTGTFFSFLPFVLLYAIPNLLGVPVVLAPEYALLGLVPFLGTLLYIVVKQRMLDMQLYIPKITLHTLYIVGLFALYLGSRSIPWAPIVFLLGALVLTGGYHWWLRRLRRRADGAKDWLEQERLKLSIHLAEKKNNRELIGMLVGILHRFIDVEGVCVIWRDSRQPIVYGTGRFAELEEMLLMDEGDREALLAKYPFYEILPMGEKSCICLGQKKNCTLFSSEELQLLETVKGEMYRLLLSAQTLSKLQASYAAMGLHNQAGDAEALAAMEGGEISKVNYLVLEALESERVHTSYFLHDQILQNLIFLSRDLEELYAKGAVSPDKIKLWLDCVYDSQREIRQLCDRLHPHLVDKMDLRESLQWLIRSMKERVRIDIGLNYRLPERLQMQDLVKMSVFRMIRELVNNAVKHAETAEIAVDVWMLENVLHLRVRDHGTGFDAANIYSQDLERQHFGLISIHHQVTNLGGGLDIQSSASAGTAVHIYIPLHREEHAYV
ncbi:hypothetical protein DCC85_21760 [Paenibacillus sp. CAA11]|uniref:sensor histidine kinase n=1 Tax=Paenibacillus sp. CAA11 TaxID=1532905 RepID=UPI000D34FCAD|nr:ATP-binding protein [Paenibacillus sp. CAA11]AWB46534.1 hypothetical protein DCC85_21760 [Paenibacillus sp. CAA11]